MKHAAVWGLCLAFLTSCRTADGWHPGSDQAGASSSGLSKGASTEPSDPDIPPSPAPLTLRDLADDPAEPPSFERRAPGDTSELAGYDAHEALSCLPLASGVTCLSPEAPFKAACEKAGGEVLRCEDCSLLCSRPFTPDPG